MKVTLMSRYADRLDHIEPFRVMSLLARANELQALGNDVIHMEVGEPDFGTPEPIVRHARRALDEGRTKYTDAAGRPELREAISRYYRTDYSLDIDPKRIFVSAGGSGALLLVMGLLVNPGDRWLMTDPGYPCNKNFLPAFNGIAQPIAVEPSSGFQLTRELLELHWQQDTQAVLLASPANPTGAVISPNELSLMYEFVRGKGGHFVVDEIYHGLEYDLETKISALELGNDVFVVNSFSKYFGMTGWRLGWMVVPEGAVSAVEKLAQNLFICPSSIAQFAALEAFSVDAREIMDVQREEFRRRRDFLVPALRDAGLVVELEPAGAFYVYARLPSGCPDSESFAKTLLEEHSVAVTPGTDFGQHEADRYVRISYAEGLDRLKEAVIRIRHALC